MPKITYEKWSPRGEARELVSQAEAICVDFQSQGYDLTLRQLYYQFVAKALIPNNQLSYDRLGQTINKARMAGYLDWNYIVDRTRNLQSNSHWTTPASIMESAADGYAEDLWGDQPNRVEVWVEKEALAGVVQRAADALDCAWFSCRGYVSQSEMWGAAQRIGRYLRNGQNVTILHLGDHDPSGIDMTRDIRERLDLFTLTDFARLSGFRDSLTYNGIRASMSAELTIERIALNMDQVEQYGPPPNPAKLTDSRAQSYIEQFGYESWELDALSPATLDELIRNSIHERMDSGLYQESEDQVERQRDYLLSASRNWDNIVDLIEGDWAE